MDPNKVFLIGTICIDSATPLQTELSFGYRKIEQSEQKR